MAQMVECQFCHYNYDPGEIVAGKCIDCMEKERKMQARSEHAFRVMTSPFYQMDLMEVLNEQETV